MTFRDSGLKGPRRASPWPLSRWMQKPGTIPRSGVLLYFLASNFRTVSGDPRTLVYCRFAAHQKTGRKHLDDGKGKQDRRDCRSVWDVLRRSLKVRRFRRRRFPSLFYCRRSMRSLSRETFAPAFDPTARRLRLLLRRKSPRWKAVERYSFGSRMSRNEEERSRPRLTE